MSLLDFGDFAKLDIRVGVIVKAERVPGAKKLLHLEIDFGGDVKSCVAGLAEYYSPEELLNKMVAAVMNLKPKKMFGLESQVMLLAAIDRVDPSKVSLLIPDRPVQAGSKVT